MYARSYLCVCLCMCVYVCLFFLLYVCFLLFVCFWHCEHVCLQKDVDVLNRGGSTVHLCMSSWHYCIFKLPCLYVAMFVCCHVCMLPCLYVAMFVCFHVCMLPCLYVAMFVSW